MKTRCRYRSVEERVFSAFSKGRGLRLSADEVQQLCLDDAVGTRITNMACIESGLEELGDDMLDSGLGLTWKQFVGMIAAKKGECYENDSNR